MLKGNVKVLKVLMLSNVYTHPHDMGNRQRIYRECCQMKILGWQVDFLFWGGKFGGDLEEMERFFGKEHFHFANKTSLMPRYQLKEIFRKKLDQKGLSRYLSFFYDRDELYYKEVEEKVEALLHRERFDILWLQYAYQSKILERLGKDIYTVIDTHDVFAYRNRIYQKKGRIPEGFYTTRGQERKSLSRADLVIAIQEEEGTYFNRLLEKYPTRSITIGDMVEFHGSSSESEMVFGFIGAENDANVVGVEWMAKKVLPLIHEMEPQCKCIIAGGICNRIMDDRSYIKLGKVETLQEYYDQITVAVNPIQNGTGLNIKGIEALSYGKPLVSTSIGAKGLSGAAGAISVCKDAGSFAEQVVLLLHDRQKCLQMSREAERFISMYNDDNRKALLKVGQWAMDKQRGE